MKKILVVDDSMVYRNAITKALKNHLEGLDIVQAKNGQEALDLVSTNGQELSIVILDMEMPVLDGVETTKKIRQINKQLPIVVFAAPTLVGAKKALEAIDSGANDFVKKFDPASANSGTDVFKDELVPKISSFLKLKSTLAPPKASSLSPLKKMSNAGELNALELKQAIEKCSLICIGSSTGGPDILRKVFAGLTSPLRVPVLMVQHMPPIFTTQFSLMLAKISGQEVFEATHGMKIEPGKFYLAPGDFHMTYHKRLSGVQLELNQGEKVCSVRPAFDVLLRSLKSYEKNILFIVMTGMGEDGARGIQEIKKNGDVVLIQDKETAVVWGMPGAVSELGLQDATLPGLEMSQMINYLKR